MMHRMKNKIHSPAKTDLLEDETVQHKAGDGRSRNKFQQGEQKARPAADNTPKFKRI